MSTATETRADLLRALGALLDPPGPGHPALAGALGLPVPAGTAWTETFVVQLPPYASVYSGPEGMLGGAAADRVAGFWRALRLPVPADADHLGALLGLWARLLDAAAEERDERRRALLRHAVATLLHEHLLPWLPGYARALAEVAAPPYDALAGLLREVLREAALAVAPVPAPAHLVDLPAPPAAGDGLDALLDGLLTPARSGIVLARGHIGALARGAGLGLRLGDRRRMLRALLEQDPAATANALSAFADTWADAHEADADWAGPACLDAARRARATGALLRTEVPAATTTHPT
jgi:hypothetical protein